MQGYFAIISCFSSFFRVSYLSNSNTYIDIEECGNEANIYSSSASDYVGGIVGFVYSVRIENCYHCGTLSGGDYAGGVIGYGWNGTVKKCFAEGAISIGTISRAGGLAGIFRGSFSESYSIISISSGVIIGTINGNETNSSNIVNCFYSGNLSSYGQKLYQGTNGSVRYDEGFYIDSLFWSNGVWIFSEERHPTLKWETAK